MAYTDFTIDQLRLAFHLKDKREKLFPAVDPIGPSAWLQETLQRTENLPKRSEKARSEAIVFPVLLEMKKRNDDFFTFFSGESLQVDKEAGLTGECDFILSRNAESFALSTPIFIIVEAKKNDLELGVPQCAAQMLGAMRYNDQFGTPIPFIFGGVTTGDSWLFMKLEDRLLLIDDRIYYITELDTILGVLQIILDQFKGVEVE